MKIVFTPTFITSYPHTKVIKLADSFFFCKNKLDFIQLGLQGGIAHFSHFIDDNKIIASNDPILNKNGILLLNDSFQNYYFSNEIRELFVEQLNDELIITFKK